MDAKHIISEIRKIVFGEEPVIEDKKLFVSATLEDGSTVEIEPELQVGAAVVAIDMDGNPTVAEDGEYKLLDGPTIRVVAGVIEEIIDAAAAPEPAAPNDMSGEQTETQEQRVKKIVESIVKESHFASEEKVSELVNALKEEFNSALAKEVQNLKEAMFTAFEKFSETEKTEPTVKPRKLGFQEKTSKNIFIK